MTVSSSPSVAKEITVSSYAGHKVNNWGTAALFFTSIETLNDLEQFSYLFCDSDLFNMYIFKPGQTQRIYVCVCMYVCMHLSIYMSAWI